MTAATTVKHTAKHAVETTSKTIGERAATPFKALRVATANVAASREARAALRADRKATEAAEGAIKLAEKLAAQAGDAALRAREMEQKAAALTAERATISIREAFSVDTKGVTVPLVSTLKTTARVTGKGAAAAGDFTATALERAYPNNWFAQLFETEHERRNRLIASAAAVGLRLGVSALKRVK